MKTSKPPRIVLITGLVSLAAAGTGCPEKPEVTVNSNPPAPMHEDTGDTGDTGDTDDTDKGSGS